MPWRVVPLLAFGLFCAWDWAVAGSELLRAELDHQKLAAFSGTVAQFDCMGDAMLDQLPSSRTRIWLDVDDGMWEQRLTEMGSPRHDIVADVTDDPDYSVTLAAETGECGAPSVVVAPVP